MQTTGPEAWRAQYEARGQEFPAEYVVRILRGRYPRLDLSNLLPADGVRHALDAGFGNGRHLVLLSRSGFRPAGFEVSEGLVEDARKTIAAHGVTADLRVGENAAIPFEDARFDLVLSWNTCYYVGEGADFDRHVEELARVTRPGGVLVCSVPKSSCFIYEGADIRNGMAKIRHDPFGLRAGQRLAHFASEHALEQAFSGPFEDFRFASVEDDCFGLAYHWHLFVARRR